MAVSLSDARLRIAAAMKLYEMDELAAHEAAEVAGVSLVEFLERRGEFGVLTFRQSPEELDREFEAALAAVRH